MQRFGNFRPEVPETSEAGLNPCSGSGAKGSTRALPAKRSVSRTLDTAAQEPLEEVAEQDASDNQGRPAASGESDRHRRRDGEARPRRSRNQDSGAEDYLRGLDPTWDRTAASENVADAIGHQSRKLAQALHQRPVFDDHTPGRHQCESNDQTSAPDLHFAREFYASTELGGHEPVHLEEDVLSQAWLFGEMPVLKFGIADDGLQDGDDPVELKLACHGANCTSRGIIG